MGRSRGAWAQAAAALAALALAPARAQAGPPPPPPPRAHSFQNVTATRLFPTVPELANNEKEVEPGDFDNDGDLDVVIAVGYSDFGSRNNKLYRNFSGTLIEVSGAPIIPGFYDPNVAGSNRDVSRNAFFRDYDQDGWLDIVIVNVANSEGEAGRTKVYMNQHDGGVFSSFQEQGLARLGPDTGGAACGGVSIDADADGDPDLYVGNYPGPPQDTLYLNDDKNPGYFIDVTTTQVPVETGPEGDYTVDVSSADLNGDGLLDLVVSNHFNIGGPDCKAYYNDLGGAGTGPGDYQYSSSVQSLGAAGFNETSIEPGDFDGDGNPDLYWSDLLATGGDRILQQVALYPWGHVVFQSLDVLPPSTGVVSRKATVADLDGDGRLDVVVMKEAAASSRPTICRNTSVAGGISFVDWTPAPAFPSGAAQRGWHSAVFDSGGDGDADIFIGGWAGDHLFEQVPGNGYDETDLIGGALPGLHGGEPAAVRGSSVPGAPDEFTFTAGSAGFVSAILRGPDDYRLTVLDGGGVPVSNSDRGAAGVEEALQAALAGPGTYRVRVETLSTCAGGLDLDGDCAVGIVDLLALLAAWGQSGHPADVDGDGLVGIGDLLALLAAWGERPWVLEVLARGG